MLAAHERLVGLQKVVWIKLPCFPEEFGQTLLVPKLQSNAVILIPKIHGKTGDDVLNLFLVELPQHRTVPPQAAEIWAPLVSTTLCADAADENRGMRPSVSVG